MYLHLFDLNKSSRHPLSTLSPPFSHGSNSLPSLTIESLPPHNHTSQFFVFNQPIRGFILASSGLFILKLNLKGNPFALYFWHLHCHFIFLFNSDLVIVHNFKIHVNLYFLEFVVWIYANIRTFIISLNYFCQIGNIYDLVTRRSL